MINYEIPLDRYPEHLQQEAPWVLALASQKNFMTLYLFGAYLDEEAFKKEYRKTGKPLDMGKSCLHFKKVDDLAMDFLAKKIAGTPPDKLIDALRKEPWPQKVSDTSALFVADGDAFVPTELTRGGWDDVTQHGSPPSGLLARAVDLVPTAAPMQVVRFTVDLFRPVPISPLTVETIVRRDGKRIQVLDAYLRSADVGGRTRVGLEDPDCRSPV